MLLDMKKPALFPVSIVLDGVMKKPALLVLREMFDGVKNIFELLVALSDMLLLVLREMLDGVIDKLELLVYRVIDGERTRPKLDLGPYIVISFDPMVMLELDVDNIMFDVLIETKLLDDVIVRFVADGADNATLELVISKLTLLALKSICFASFAIRETLHVPNKKYTFDPDIVVVVALLLYNHV